MRRFLKRVTPAVMRDRRGVTAIEYAVLASAMVVGTSVSAISMGHSAASMFSGVLSAITGSSSSSASGGSAASGSGGSTATGSTGSGTSTTSTSGSNTESSGGDGSTQQGGDTSYHHDS